MTTSIPGGATLRADGKTWQDANGAELKSEQIRAVEQLHADRTAERNRAEAARMATEAQSNPIANALMAVLRPGSSPSLSPALPQRTATLADTVGQEYADKLAQAGYGDLDAVAQASDEQLLAVEGIGPKTLEKLRAAKR